MADYIADVFMTLDGYGTGTEGYWGKGGPELDAESAVAAIPRLKAESSVPLRGHGSLSMNRSLLAAGLVDRLEVTVFPIINGATGSNPVFADLPDIDLELIESELLDGRVQRLVYVPTLRT